MSFEAKEQREKSTRSSGAKALQPVDPFADYGNPSIVYEESFGSDKDEHVEDEIEAAAIPAPDVKARNDAKPIPRDRAPTVQGVLAPTRPDLAGADAGVVGKATVLVVDAMYHRLEETLATLKLTLEKTPPPPDTPFALKLIGWAVEQVASFTINAIGRIAADALFKHVPTSDAPDFLMPRPPLLPASATRQQKRKAARTAKKAAERLEKKKDKYVKEAVAAKQEREVLQGPTPPATPSAAHATAVTTSMTTGAKAGKALHDQIAGPPISASSENEIADRALPGASMVDEFLAQQRGALLVRKVNAINTLDLVAASAEQTGMTDLNDKLMALLASNELTGWFSRKVACEWLNFNARASLGPHQDGQTTFMPGANTFQGIADAGPDARHQWQSGQGFVEIVLKTPARVDGLKGVSLQSATIPSSYGAALILESMRAMTDAHGTHYNLATMPVYKRVHIQTGEGALSRVTAFVITPDGRVEVDTSNPALAAIGQGVPREIGETPHIVGGIFTDEERADETEWSKRMNDSASALAGAMMIRDMLRGISPSVLK